MHQVVSAVLFVIDCDALQQEFKAQSFNQPG